MRGTAGAFLAARSLLPLSRPQPLLLWIPPVHGHWPGASRHHGMSNSSPFPTGSRKQWQSSFSLKGGAPGLGGGLAGGARFMSGSAGDGEARAKKIPKVGKKAKAEAADGDGAGRAVMEDAGAAPVKRKRATKQVAEDDGEGGEPPAKKARGKREKEKVELAEGEEWVDEDYVAKPISADLAKQAMPRLVQGLQKTLGVEKWMAEGAANLFREGATLPFIARYRKETTGGLDEEQLRQLQAYMERFDNLEMRKHTVLASLEKTGNLTAELRAKLEACQTLSEVEDMYLPFRPKRKTRASDARAKGLQPLADMLMGKATAPFTAQDLASMGPVEAAKKSLGFAKEVGSSADALKGARDIVAEVVCENADVRKSARQTLKRGLHVVSKERKAGADEKKQYTSYHDRTQFVDKLRAYQILAMQRGEKEKCLSVKLKAADHAKNDVVKMMQKHIAAQNEGRERPHGGAWAAEIESALQDGLDRLLLPVLEREAWKSLLENAEEEALETFRMNLRNMLLQPPVKGCSVCAVDPGYRTGCKVAVVSDTGKVLAADAIYPHASSSKQAEEASTKLKGLLSKHKCTTLALGNGQASRETEAFLRGSILSTSDELRYTIVNEAGASIYSASKLASAELPELDVSLRGAVSLARRVQDPLAELVKVDPKSIGVGLYQHDVDQKRLANELSKVVELAVNTVGVDLNTASPSLLRRIAGLTEKVAQAVVKRREDEGPFKSRKDLMDVKGLGKKIFEQAAGFVRVFGGKEPLDATAIHPESYAAAKKLLKKHGNDVGKLSATADVKLAEELGVGAQTLADIVESLKDPKSDPREKLLGLPPVAFKTAKGVEGEEVGMQGGKKVISASSKGIGLAQLEEGMWLRGVIRNVVEFGSFVDVGVQQDGLLHSSQVKRGTRLEVGGSLNVRVLSIDRNHASGRARISLSTLDEGKPAPGKQPRS